MRRRSSREDAVLIAEDELRLADAIARGLRRQGMAVDLARDGEAALAKARVVRRCCTTATWSSIQPVGG